MPLRYLFLMAYLEFEKLSFSYIKDNNTLTILKDCSFRFPNVGLVSFLGESGVGKTTILNLIAGFITNYQGKIKRNYNINETGYVFQNLYLIEHLKVKDNILLGKILNGEDLKSNYKEVKKLLSQVNMEGYENKKVKELSGGQKARIALLRSIANKSKVLLLDEPTGCLDSQNAINIMEIIKKLSKDMLIIMVTHNKQLANQYSDYILQIQNKKIVSSTPVKNNVESFQVESKPKKGKIRIYENVFLSLSFLKSKLKKVVFSLLFMSICFCLMCVSLNLTFSGKKALEDYTKGNMDYTTINLQQKKKYQLKNNSMSLIKLDLLDSKYKKKIKENFEIDFYSNLEYFLPSAISLKYNGIFYDEKVSLLPCFPQIEKLESGLIPTKYNDIIINKPLYNFLKTKNYNKKGLSYLSSNSVESRYLSTSVNDLVEFDLKFNIVGISKENTLFNKFIIYYPYTLMKDYIFSYKLKNLTELCNFSYDVNLGYRIENLSYENDLLTSLKTLAYVKDPLLFNEYIKTNFKDEISIYSTTIDLNNSILELMDSISKLVILFLILSVISSLFLEIVIVENLYQDKKKELAIYLSFHINKKQFLRLGKGQVYILFSLNMFITFLNYIIISLLGNYFLNKFNLPKFFSLSIDFKIVIIIMLVSFVINYIASIFPLKGMYDSNLLSSLKGE